MDHPPETLEKKRAQKRPHSPAQETSTSEAIPTQQLADEDVLQSDSKRDKLLRLLGGKKRKNETAASKWLERVRSREDEIKVSTELESQFNESLTNRLTGASRRHLGIGFKDEVPPVTTTAEGPPLTNVSSTIPPSGTTQGSIVSRLSQRANVPSLSNRNSTPINSYQPPFSQHGPPNMNPPWQMYPQNCNMVNSMQPLGYQYPPQMQNYGGYCGPPPQHLGHSVQQIPLPPIPELKPPPPPPEDKPPEPKSRNAFYAQFKKAS